jgi:hypothetical protein
MASGDKHMVDVELVRINRTSCKGTHRLPMGKKTKTYMVIQRWGVNVDDWRVKVQVVDESCMFVLMQD